jgi:hypothetical protein
MLRALAPSRVRQAAAASGLFGGNTQRRAITCVAQQFRSASGAYAAISTPRGHSLLEASSRRTNSLSQGSIRSKMTRFKWPPNLEEIANDLGPIGSVDGPDKEGEIEIKSDEQMQVEALENMSRAE